MDTGLAFRRAVALPEYWLVAAGIVAVWHIGGPLDLTAQLAIGLPALVYLMLKADDRYFG